jgi:hypothetical protein
MVRPKIVSAAKSRRVVCDADYSGLLVRLGRCGIAGWLIRSLRFSRRAGLDRHSAGTAKLSGAELRLSFPERRAVNFSPAGLRPVTLNQFPLGCAHEHRAWGSRIMQDFDLFRRARISTRDFPDDKRLATWREVYGRGISNVDIEPIGDAPFQAESRHRGRLALARALHRQPGAGWTEPGRRRHLHVAERGRQRNAVRQGADRRRRQRQRVGVRCALDQHFAFRGHFRHPGPVAARHRRTGSELRVGFRLADPARQSGVAVAHQISGYGAGGRRDEQPRHRAERVDAHFRSCGAGARRGATTRTSPSSVA